MRRVLYQVEAEWTGGVDEIWVTDRPEGEVVKVVKQVKARRRLAQAEAPSSLRVQPSTEGQTSHISRAANRDGARRDLKLRLWGLWEKLAGRSSE